MQPSQPATAAQPAQILQPAAKKSWASFTFVTVLPLYIIVIAVCLIALPKSMTANWFGLIPQPMNVSAGQSPAASASAPGVSPIAPDSRAIADVAKMAIDSSKDRADAMKDTYDKLFSLFAALGALLAFLGFKGVDTFMTAKQRSEEIVQTANAAVERANAAYARAELANKEHAEFLKVRYAQDNTAEINAAHGIIMREIAELYKTLRLCQDPAVDVAKDPNYRKYLDTGRYYLDQVTDRPTGLNAKVVTRALVTRGNILRRQEDYLGALKMVELVLENYDATDAGALFNAACYCALIAEYEDGLSNRARSRDYRQKSLAYLARAIAVDGNLREDALDDADLQWLRGKQDPRFQEITK
ncbi:hypothetical protein K6L09_09250 [Burkholderia cepacia]